MHHLHKQFDLGYKAAERGDEECPHVPGTSEHAWWWEGWNISSSGGINGYGEKMGASNKLRS